MRKLLAVLFCASMLAAQGNAPTRAVSSYTVTSVDDLPRGPLGSNGREGVVAMPVTVAVRAGATAPEVGKAIAAAASAHGWIPSLIGEGAIEAKLLVRKHELVVDIAYAATEYTIKYKSSKNLRYSEVFQTIHKNYKVWLKNLDTGIQGALQAAAIQKALADPSGS